MKPRPTGRPQRAPVRRAPPPPACIRLFGVRQNNLKGFNLDLPLGELIAVTGLSGSGKSSLAIETLYAEGQRRYIETFSPYARQFFDRMDKPAVDRIENIPPAIAIEQRNSVRTTRSTVGTMTEICEHLKQLWPHLATLHCRQCQRVIRRESANDVWDFIHHQPSPPPEFLVTFTLPLTDKLPLAEQLQLVARQGFHRILLNQIPARIEDVLARLTDAATAAPASLLVIADRFRSAALPRPRLVEACEQAFQFGHGRLALWAAPPPADSPATPESRDRPWTPWHPFSNHFHCATCNLDYREPTPALFSFNHPTGACPSCKGFGRIIRIDPGLAIPDRSKSLAGGAVRPWQTGMSAECQSDLLKAARKRGVPNDVPFHRLSLEHQQWVVDGDPGYGSDKRHEWPHLWYGIRGYFRWLESKSYKMHVRVLLSRYRSYTECPDCHGQRFNPESLQFTAPVPPHPGQPPRPTTLAQFYALPIRDALNATNHWTQTLQPKPHEPLGILLAEIHTRLSYLVSVGLSYLTLDRPTRTLSGGETERVNLTTCLGSRLVNALFVLDEPSVGLHPRDTDRLIQILHRLRDAGNTVVVVEHEPSVIHAANRIVDLGPGHGDTGGHITFNGPHSSLANATGSLTADYLTGRRHIPTPAPRPVQLRNRIPQPATERTPQSHALPTLAEAHVASPASTPTATTPSPLPWLHLHNASAHNLHQLSVDIPLQRLVCITGVSGSGKSTLVRDILVPLLTSTLGARDRDEAPDEADSPDASPEGTPPVSALHTAATLEGTEHLGAVVHVDQSPLGRTPRSNPAVYLGAFEDIRDLFAATPAARAGQLGSTAFSFNSRTGQCERCRGAGFEKIEMQFLSDVFIRCPECRGRRYRPHILQICIPLPPGLPSHLESTARTHPQGWSIADILEAPTDDALAVLEALPPSKPSTRAIARLRVLRDVGLGYLRLGQPINTLSGGECQRLKLAAHLADAPGSAPTTTCPPDSARPTLFILDEPTTGLHFEDVRILLAALHRLVDAGHSVLIVEHNLDVIRNADWIIDLGPDAGSDGGRIVATGTPHDVAACPGSHTGRFLAASRQCG